MRSATLDWGKSWVVLGQQAGRLGTGAGKWSMPNSENKHGRSRHNYRLSANIKCRNIYPTVIWSQERVHLKFEPETNQCTIHDMLPIGGVDK